VKDLANAQLAYRRAETDLMASVRSAHFAALVGQEEMKANRALMELTDQVYKVMLAQLKSGLVATYEPAQVGVYAGQARIAYLTSRNDYLLAWKNLAAAVGMPLMPATDLSGSLANNLPRFDYERALAHLLKNHTDVLTAQYVVEKARYQLRLAQANGVPDVTLGATLLYDGSQPPTRLVPNLILSVPVPLFNRNQGNIYSAQAALMRALEEPHRVQNALTASFSDAFRRMEENRLVLGMYRQQLLPQQVQAFRAAVIRHFAAGAAEGVAFNDLIGAEQNVITLIASYLTTLGAYWQATSDVASLLQTDDVYTMADGVAQLPPLDLAEVLVLPCCHPCSSAHAAPVPPVAPPVLPPPQTLPPPGAGPGPRPVATWSPVSAPVQSGR
jgi:cobalt-zinc-cadmium efflux system outer membrane protein